MNGKMKVVLLTVALTACIAFLPLSGHAAVFNFNDPVNGYGTAVVTTGAGSIEITLTDLALNPTSVIQNISGFTFQASSGADVSTVQFVTPTSIGGLVTVGTDTTPGNTPIQWGFSGTSAMYVLGWNPPAPPDYTIIGPTNNNYADAQGSLLNNDPHNPFIDQTATFMIFLDGITSETSIANGTIQFGTSWNPPTTVPEAGTLLMLGTGLIGLVGYRRMRRMQ